MEVIKIIVGLSFEVRQFKINCFMCGNIVVTWENLCKTLVATVSGVTIHIVEGYTVA